MRPGSIVRIVESFNKSGKPLYGLIVYAIYAVATVAVCYLGGMQVGAALRLIP